MFPDQAKNVSFTLQAVVVTPSNDADLDNPGMLFLDESSTDGNVKVDLLKGGTCTFAITKAGGIECCPIVKKVYADGTTAVNIFVNPLAQ